MLGFPNPRFPPYAVRHLHVHGAPAYGRYPTRSIGGNALAAHTRSEIDSDGLSNAGNYTCVGFGGLLAGPSGYVVISLVCRKHAGRTHAQRDCLRWPQQCRNHYVCNVWTLSTGPKDESPLVSIAGNALAAHTRSEIHSDGRKQCVPSVWLPLMGPNGRVETNLNCWKRAGPQRDCFQWLPQRRNRYVCSVLRLPLGPKDESSVVLTAGNALAAHTRNEIHSEHKKRYVTAVSLLLTGPNGRVVISLDCWKRAGRTHAQRD